MTAGKQKEKRDYVYSFSGIIHKMTGRSKKQRKIQFLIPLLLI
jgi:hypothetical protein